MTKIKLLAAALALSFAAGSTGAGAADLIEAYQSARQSDPQLAAAEASSRAVGENVTIARSTLLPNINGSASVNESRDDLFSSSDGDLRTRTYGVNLNQSVFDWGNYTNLGAARARNAAAQADYEFAVDTLLLRVAEAYFGVLAAEDALAFAEAEERAVGRQLEQAEQRFEVGLTAVTDVHEARARHDAARAAVIAAGNALDDAREALAEITGEHYGSVLALRLDIPLEGPDPDELEAWEQAALQASPALAASRFTLEAAERDIGTARSGHLPSLNASVGWQDRKVLRGFDPELGGQRQADGGSIGLILNVPIFSGFATQARVRQSVYQRDFAEEILEAERRNLLRQTRNDFRSVVAGISSIEARRQALLSAQSALEATQAGFEVGTRTIVDVLLAQQLLFQAQRDYSNARHQFILNGLRLKRTVGIIEFNDLEEVNALLTAERLTPEEIGARVAAQAQRDGERR
ncbi:MAG: TolC family outer membrane protein [Xanthomonadales bacterium]|nr:TolC family outer membrane protein [Xanthomonadales bacterium]